MQLDEQFQELGGPARALHELIASAFRDAGWAVDPELTAERDFGADLLVSGGGRRYAVQFKFARDSRRAQLQALMADSLLQARHHAAILGARPLAIVGAPAISQSTAAELERYVRRFADGDAYGLVDARGRFELHGEDLQGVHPRNWPEWLRDDAYRSAASREPARDLFSDRNRWLFKVLLAAWLPREMVRARRDRLLSTSQLVGAADLPPATVSRFVSMARREGYLEHDERTRSLRLVRIRSLLEQWRDVSARRPLQYGARWVFLRSESNAQSLDQLRQALRSVGSPVPRACLAVFAACQQLGLDLVQGVAPHLYLESARDSRGLALLERLGLRRAEEGERVDVFVREPAWPESVFRAAVDREGVSSTDVIQCWLDASHERTRGREQAALIWDHVLEPSFPKDDAT